MVRAIADALSGGPSAFFQRLLSEARGAKLPVETVLDVGCIPRSQLVIGVAAGDEFNQRLPLVISNAD